MRAGFGHDGSSYALRFRYQGTASGTDSFAEQNFGLPDSGEIWLEYWLYVPSNFAHRSDAPMNNKFMQLNYNGSRSQILTVEYERQSSNSSYMRRFLSTSEHADGSSNWPVGDRNTSDFIGPNARIKPGPSGPKSEFTTRRVRARTSVTGRAEVFVNGQLVHALDWGFWDRTFSGHVNGGYLLGWSDSGFDQQTDFFIDDFKVWTQNPNWQ